jgi:hypothetical protein
MISSIQRNVFIIKLINFHFFKLIYKRPKQNRNKTRQIDIEECSNQME